MPATSKKPKTSSDNDDFETVKRYLLDCPHVSQDHPAIRAAMEGIEKEQKRLERDAKLQMKFAQATTSSSTPSTSSPSSVNTNLSDSVVVVAPSSGPPCTEEEEEEEEDTMMESEWQDVAEKKEDDENGSFLGRELAKLAIDAISEHQVRAKSPTSAIALVIHAALRSDKLGFACTGIPPHASSCSGFAPPVRELPKTQFLPPKWDATPDTISLRYRKNGTGAMILKVSKQEDDKIHVQLVPANSKEPPCTLLEFAITEHVNLDSWNAALKQASSVQPALHYKFLPVLLTNFCTTHDLGAVGDDTNSGVLPYVDNTIPTAVSSQSRTFLMKSDIVPPQQPVPAIAAGTTRRNKPYDGVPSTLNQAFPDGRMRPPGGDFADDLAPAGLRDPRFLPAHGGGGGRMGGNLMGPNHPQFMGGMMGGGGGGGGRIPGMMGGGPGTMQPRFDPMYPPGTVDIGIDGKPRRGRTTGEPNPDHLPPPNSFGHDMFS